MKEKLIDLAWFILKELRACLFPGLFLVLLVVSKYVHIPYIYRYDFLFGAAVLIQVLMLVFKLETKDEAKVIILFHVVGMILELYKTSSLVGSWSYPEPGMLKIMNVPLYSGFLYASVGSYLAHAWKVLHVRLQSPPRHIFSVLLCILIYINFFTNHFMYDFRWFLIGVVFILYRKTKIYFTPHKKVYHIPLSISFLLIAFFIWIAENIGTFSHAWVYPNQVHAWNVVSLHKITSWFLLVIISFIIVAYLKHVKEGRKKSTALES